MDGDSRIKILAAGFTIIRAADDPSPRIKYCINGFGSWGTYEKGFKSKAERDRRFKELMKQPNIIND